MAESQPAARSNRLAGETSPYLLQHAHNPVDWHPWGPEAFDRARREDKPIFLSVGYSTCYWCHVMERQSFENPEVAAVMNAHFVNIKVDREERPDVDQLYMTAVQVQTHHGGWPMSAFLTPDLQYFYGGTYFPPHDAHGRPGFVTLLEAIAEAWQNRREEVRRSAEQFTRILRELARVSPSRRSMRVDASTLRRLLEASTDDEDPVHGGFGRAPKFPRQTLLELLLGAHAAGWLPDALTARLRRALDGMMYGGIRDQLGGGFHRYSTDARWLVPHFEIMLYDNAMLAQSYALAAAQLDEPRYAEVARQAFDFVLRAMTSPHGAFYTAFDAEVNAREGEPYLWTAEEVRRSLSAAGFSPDEASLFCRVFGLDAGPNFADPHGDDPSPRANVLFVADRAAFHASASVLSRMRAALLTERERRPQPLLDTKVITSWNALMIRALAVGGAALGDRRYVQAAARAAEWLLSNHAAPGGGVYRASRDGKAKYLGFLDDYAFLAEALLDLHEATGEPRWRTDAERLAAEMQKRFQTPVDNPQETVGRGFYFSDASADDLIVRQQVATDSPLPAGAAVAASVMRRLGRRDVAEGVVRAFAPQLERYGPAMSRLVLAALELLRDQSSIDVPATAAADSGPTGGPLEAVAASAERVVDLSAERVGPRRIRVTLRIADGWHIQANPAGDRLIPTRVSLPPMIAPAVDRIVYPSGQPLDVDFADEPVPVYTGTVHVEVNLARDLPANALTLAVEYQACDHASCLPPVTRQTSVA